MCAKSSAGNNKQLLELCVEFGKQLEVVIDSWSQKFGSCTWPTWASRIQNGNLGYNHSRKQFEQTAPALQQHGENTITINLALRALPFIAPSLTV